HRRLHQVEQEVKVMDHQVQNDANVRRTAGKGAESFALDEPRPEVVLLKLFKSGIEPLDMTDLEHRRMAARQLDEGVGLFQGRGQGFFDEQRNAAPQEVARDRMMVSRGNFNSRGINQMEQQPMVVNGLSPVPPA